MHSIHMYICTVFTVIIEKIHSQSCQAKELLSWRDLLCWDESSASERKTIDDLKEAIANQRPPPPHTHTYFTPSHKSIVQYETWQVTSLGVFFGRSRFFQVHARETPDEISLWKYWQIVQYSYTIEALEFYQYIPIYIMICCDLKEHQKFERSGQIKYFFSSHIAHTKGYRGGMGFSRPHRSQSFVKMKKKNPDFFFAKVSLFIYYQPSWKKKLRISHTCCGMIMSIALTRGNLSHIYIFDYGWVWGVLVRPANLFDGRGI